MAKAPSIPQESKTHVWGTTVAFINIESLKVLVPPRALRILTGNSKDFLKPACLVFDWLAGLLKVPLCRAET